MSLASASTPGCGATDTDAAQPMVPTQGANHLGPLMLWKWLDRGYINKQECKALHKPNMNRNLEAGCWITGNESGNNAKINAKGHKNLWEP